MRFVALSALFLFISCAHHDSDRAPASYQEVVFYGDPDLDRSSVKMFPPEYSEKTTRHYYYVELKDDRGMHIDRDIQEFEVREKKKSHEIKVERVLRGRYYLILDADKNLSTGDLDFYVAGQKLIESFRLGMRPAHPSHTKMRKLRATNSRAKFELVLKDKKGRFVETPEPPEIVLSSESNNDTQIEKIEHMGSGIWHITLRYPYGNQLIYISVRSHGIEFKNLFRFQYIEKQ